MPGLNLKLKNKSIGKYQLQKGLSLTIGRHADNDVVIEDSAVSGHHAKIDSIGNRFVLIDLQSKNGTFINEQLINSHWLKDGDVIDIGEHTLVFEWEEEEQMLGQDSAKSDDTLSLNSTQRRRMMQKSMPHKSINVVRFWDKSANRGEVKNIEAEVSNPVADSETREVAAVLTCLSGGNDPIKLTRKITTIGKHPASDIVVKGLLQDQTAATISREADGFYLNYIGGLPKPKVNDRTVKDATLLNHLDIIEIGSTKLQFSFENLEP
jgi:pSer/pThr/pTyr-binding forkhead associated (FHA) protein